MSSIKSQPKQYFICYDYIELDFSPFIITLTWKVMEVMVVLF